MSYKIFIFEKNSNWRAVENATFGFTANTENDLLELWLEKYPEFEDETYSIWQVTDSGHHIMLLGGTYEKEDYDMLKDIFSNYLTLSKENQLAAQRSAYFMAKEMTDRELKVLENATRRILNTEKYKNKTKKNRKFSCAHLLFHYTKRERRRRHILTALNNNI